MAEGLNVDQRIDVVAACEAFDKFGFVLLHSSLDIVSESNVQRARLVGHDVDVVDSVRKHVGIIERTTLRNQTPMTIAEPALSILEQHGIPGYAISQMWGLAQISKWLYSGQ